MYRPILFTIFIFLSSFSFAQDSNLLLSYSFDGNTNDLSGNNYNGIVVNAVPSSDFEGNAESAYLFNGLNSYISAGSSDNLRAVDALTIQAQIQALGPGSDNAGGIIVNKEGEYSFARFADGSLRYAIAFSDDWGSHVNTGVYLPLNEKTEVALTYSAAAGEINIYVDCELVHTKEENRTIQDVEPSLNELRIGGRQFSIDQNFFGIIDEVNIYNIALSQDELNCVSTSTGSIIADNLSIYPNPLQNIINIDNINEEIRKINIIDLNGNTINQFQTNSTKESFSLKGYPSGPYILLFLDENGSLLLSKKVVKL